MEDAAPETHHSPALGLRDFVTHRLARTQAKLNAQAAAVLARYGNLSLVQWRILALLHDNGAGTAQEICRISAMDKGQVSRRVRGLLRDGLVESWQARTDDQRQHGLRLTALGRQVYDHVAPAMRQRHEHILADVTPEERRVLLSALEKIEAATDRRDF